jgi:hypothetical protein
LKFSLRNFSFKSAFIIKFKSSTDLPSGPIVRAIFFCPEKIGPTYVNPSEVTLPAVGLKPNIPQKALGILILPPRSDPRPRGEHLAAISPPSPPVLPPVVLVLFQGFKARPHISFTVSIVNPTFKGKKININLPNIVL